MTIRTFTAGDDAAQVSIYNEAAADLPKFKAATLDELRRRLRGPDFDPATRFFAVEGGRPVGYASFHLNGRVSYPWCRKGREQWAGPLFDAVLGAMRSRGLPAAFAAYRADWPAQCEFFLAHGFALAREMVNFVMELTDMPTPSVRGRRRPPADRRRRAGRVRPGAEAVSGARRRRAGPVVARKPLFPAGVGLGAAEPGGRGADRHGRYGGE